MFEIPLLRCCESVCGIHIWIEEDETGFPRGAIFNVSSWVSCFLAVAAFMYFGRIQESRGWSIIGECSRDSSKNVPQIKIFILRTMRN